MSESPEVQIARLDERCKNLLSAMEQEREVRQATNEKIDNLQKVLMDMSGRMENVESAVALAAPTLNEFVTLKHRIIGAGVAGKIIWACTAGLLGFMYGAREQISHLLTRGN